MRQVCRRYKAAVVGAREALNDLNDLKAVTLPEDIAEWDMQAADAQKRRTEDPRAMDIYDTTAVLRQ